MRQKKEREEKQRSASYHHQMTSSTPTTKKKEEKTIRTTTTKNKRPLPTNYHQKKSLKKKLEVLAKYELLKRTPGKLEKELAKRRKKISRRGQKFMPRTRR